ncbi:DUF1205 domain-containing protein [Streptomyces sp. M2CJ-2]|uniref:nucleotide disphospho-sugar-binding domain-containing protein n=1 Tax=Streptomyces sp. M2CJ-2 TaxID=2803948 RepID=UPI0019278777|nr:nucleotide disphospho-sugar-binding domain-containing protein [Streptomyces sp. M2CJ-2]MBL3669893.1 DUF1205 domain-containing protein [Streptomyces sp. M2CJ-2]
MRVLFAVPAAPERLHNMVPLGWALRAAGHEVQVAAPPRFAPRVNRTGLVAVEAGPDEPAPDGALAGPDAAADLAAYLGVWRHDLLVWDSGAPAAAAAAAEHGVPGARLLMPGEEYEDGAGHPAPGLVLDPTPPSLRTVADSATRPLRHVPYDGPAVLPAWLGRAPKRIRVCLVLDGGRTPVAQVLAALPALDAEVVARLAEDRIPPGASVPDNLRLVDELPLSTVLSTCAAVVHDGSSAAAAAALAAGLPQLDLGGAESGTALARLLERHGAALTADTGDPDALGGQLGRLLADPALGAAARRLGEENAALPGPPRLASWLGDEVTATRPWKSGALLSD